MSKSISIIIVIVNTIASFCQSIYTPDKTSLLKFAVKLQYFNISSGLTPLDIELEPFNVSQHLTFFNDTICHQIPHRYIEDCSLCINNLQRKAMLDKVREASTLSNEFIGHDSLTVAITSVYKHFIDSRGSSDSSKSICLAGAFSLQLLRAIQLVNVNRSIKLIVNPINGLKEAQISSTISTSIINKLNSDANFEQVELINIDDLIQGDRSPVSCDLLHVRLTEEDERISSLQQSLPSPIEEFVHALLSANDSSDSSSNTESTIDIILESETISSTARSRHRSDNNSNKQQRLAFDWLAHHTAVPSQDTIQFDQDAWTSNDAINCHLPVRYIVAESSSTMISISVGSVRRLSAHPFQHYFDHALNLTDTNTYTGTDTNYTDNQYNRDCMSSGGQIRITGDCTSGTYLRRSPVFADRVVWEFHYRNTSNTVNDLAYERMRRDNNYTIDHSKFTPDYTTPDATTDSTGASDSIKGDDILSFVSFSYNGEMIVQLHLEYLYAHVDCFIITEAWHTFSGNKKKELYIHKYRDLFLPYVDKIQFLVIDSFPAPSAGWQKSFQLRRVSSFDLSRVEMEHVQQTWFRETFQRDVVSGFLAKVYGRYNNSDVSSDVGSYCNDYLVSDDSRDSNNNTNSGSTDFSKCCSAPHV